MSRVYSAAELELFARYVPARADHRPAGCNYAAECWVEVGPPALSMAGGSLCRGCGCSVLGVPDGKRERPGPVPRYAR